MLYTLIVKKIKDRTDHNFFGSFVPSQKLLIQSKDNYFFIVEWKKTEGYCGNKVYQIRVFFMAVILPCFQIYVVN
jgi:hypothetical protein